jgi:hypothetical protein
MKTDVTNDYSNEVRTFIDFPQRDEKGRRCGVVIVKWSALVYEVPETAGSYWSTLEPGTYIRVVVMSTRNRQGFGASQGAPFFKTEAEAQAYIDKRVRGTEKRYAQKYGS